jgi:lipopolysaccharide/colanic/teichoic acid biosynthesis glycosyltransferase
MTARKGIPRSVEVSIALATLLLLAPLLLVCIALVRWGSGHPVFFRQQRMGFGGKPFTLIKFRTMYASSSDAPQITAEGDGRITPTGLFLRRMKLDELPQLWNVVRGDMALVGPRPEALAYVDPNEPRWREVLQVRPGLTDPVTIALRNEQLLLAQVLDDREAFYMQTLQPFKLSGYVTYLHQRSWRTDVRVLWDTALAVMDPDRTPVFTLDEIKASVTASR